MLTKDYKGELIMASTHTGGDRHINDIWVETPVIDFKTVTIECLKWLTVSVPGSFEKASIQLSRRLPGREGWKVGGIIMCTGHAYLEKLFEPSLKGTCGGIMGNEGERVVWARPLKALCIYFWHRGLRIRVGGLDLWVFKFEKYFHNVVLGVSYFLPFFFPFSLLV